MQKTIKKIRSSNIELLRIFAMLMIILHHIGLHCIYKQLTDTSSISRMHNGLFNHPLFYKKLLILASLMPIGKIGNILFILITGYFMVSKGKNIDLAKIAKNLLTQLLFAASILTLLPTILHLLKKDIVMNLLEIQIINSMSWFVGYYFIIILIATLFLNKYLCTWNSRSYYTFLIVIFALIQFSYSGTLADGLINGLRNVGTGVFIYSLGGYIRLYNPFKAVRTYSPPYTFPETNIQYYFVNHTKDEFIQQLSNYDNYSMVVIIIGVAIFELFRHIHIKDSQILNFVGKSTFMVYLLHDNNFFRSLWNTQDWITLLYYHPYLFIRKIFLWAIAVFLIGIVGYIVYNVIYKVYEKHKWLVTKIN